MATGKQIKIIKRAERHERQAAPTEKRSDRVGNPDGGVMRDAVSVVNVWVRELRLKKAAEAARGFERLFVRSAAGATQ